VFSVCYGPANLATLRWQEGGVLSRNHLGPAGALAPEEMVLRHTVSDNKGYGQEQASHEPISARTGRSTDQKTRSIRRRERQKPWNRHLLCACARWSII